MHKHAIKVISRRLFRSSVCVLALGLLLEFVNIWPPGAIAQRIISPLGLQPVGIPFTLGVLVLFVNVYSFYVHILYRTEGTAGDSYFSLGVMILMLLTSVLIFIDDVSPYKFLVLSLMVLAMAIQNYIRMRQCEGTPFGARFAGWFWEALVYFFCLLAAGIVYALAWSSSLLENAWGFWIVMTIQVGFLFEVFRVFLGKSRYFGRFGYKRDLSQFYGSD